MPLRSSFLTQAFTKPHTTVVWRRSWCGYVFLGGCEGSGRCKKAFSDVRDSSFSFSSVLWLCQVLMNVSTAQFARRLWPLFAIIYLIGRETARPTVSPGARAKILESRHSALQKHPHPPIPLPETATGYPLTWFRSSWLSNTAL